MASKKEETKPAAKASEAEAPKAEAPKAKTSGKKSAKKAKIIKVQPTAKAKRDLNEPFQGILIRLGAETPVEETSWVKSQIDAGLIEKC